MAISEQYVGKLHSSLAEKAPRHHEWRVAGSNPVCGSRIYTFDVIKNVWAGKYVARTAVSRETGSGECGM